MMTDDELAEVAQELICRVRDDDPDTNLGWFVDRMPDPNDWMRLAFVLACAMPLDRTWRQLTAWTLGDGGPDTPELIAQRRHDLDEALRGAPGRHERTRGRAA